MTPHSKFIQNPPKLSNEYLEDLFLRDYLKIHLKDEILTEIEPDLIQFGQKVAIDYIVWARDAEINNPILTQFDAFGKRIDEIKVAEGWLKLEKAAAEEGLVAIGYERKYGSLSRLYQFVKLYLFTPSSAIFTCPLAMTDGAARLIELYGDEELKNEVFNSLTSRNPMDFKTSGQWMTERTGGSDVSKSMTFAEQNGSSYLLKGHKWFTSAITANVAFTLASTEIPENTNKKVPLSLFFLNIRNQDGSLNGIEVEALKNKLGTKALPTAQLKLIGVNAKMVGEKGKGIKSISTLFNITRIYNTISAVSYIRRAYSLCKIYSIERQAFGKNLENHILYQNSLRKLEIGYQSCSLLAFFVTELLGKEECNEATEIEKSLLRFLTPIAKLYTAKQAIKFSSEYVEMFGGIGYLEDSGIPVLLRDAQVLSIWEGTTNVLSLDMLRAIDKDHGFQAFTEYFQKKLTLNSNEVLSQKLNFLITLLQEIKLDKLESQSRDLAFYVAELTIGILWNEFISKNNNESYKNALKYWLKFKMSELSLETCDYL